MFHWSKSSQAKLDSCCRELQLIADKALAYGVIDIKIVHGYRGEQEQNDLYHQTPPATAKLFPYSKHNHETEGEPDSLAVDFAPVVNGTIHWRDTHSFALVAGLLMAAARELGFTLRWGGDWDRDGQTTDQTLMDYGHVEVVRK
jgi:peptidoglycan L-alanyl-D-glutamate endopeptidase CwlK